jgi:hypothetical protein
MVDRQRIDDLGEKIAGAAAALDRGEHALLTAIRQFDELDGWHYQGALSLGMWLSWRIGMSPAVAREKVRVAKALARLPAIDGALEQGQVSYSKVRAMTRVATPENEQTLLELALCSTAAELERICRLFRKATSPAEAQEADSRRYVSCRETEDGMVVLTARLHPDEAARVMEALRVSAD